jgi:hypothetical protein
VHGKEVRALKALGRGYIFFNIKIFSLSSTTFYIGKRAQGIAEFLKYIFEGA